MALFSTGKLGFVLTAIGAAHFAAPDVFAQITKPVFPENTQDWVVRNGVTESAIGAAMMLKPTRKLGLFALLGHAVWLGYNAANAKR